MMLGGAAEMVDETEMKLASRDRVLVVPAERIEQLKRIGLRIANEPFEKRPWSELFYFASSSLLVALGIGVIAALVFSGVILAITFVGIVLIACAVRCSRGFGQYHRELARSLLGIEIVEPDPFIARRGFFGWLQTSLKDRTGWRAMGYLALKVPLTFLGVYFTFSIWVCTFFCLAFPILGSSSEHPPEYGVIRNLFPPGYFSIGNSGFVHGAAIFLTGVFLLFVAPWPMRLLVYLDRQMMRFLLSPDPLMARMRSLQESRARSVDASAAMLRRIERDLHDGTQAQLVALAMRLGQAKEKLDSGGSFDMNQVRWLIDEAHRGAKEAIVELRDLARGIHPPALDVGLEGALSTLASRSSVPSDVSVVMYDRPTPAIEAIAYFCVAELLANVAQHAAASRASISCSQHGGWLRVVVRDDGRGGARAATVGSSSSGLSGLSDRVHAVDGRLDITSPEGGPTVVTVDLPLHA